VSDYTTMTRWNELPGGIGEDCLVLNVYAPGLNDGARRPVMFSIHGGGYASGTSGNPVFDGVSLATLGDVILVTVNHRLGILGYIELGAYAGVREFGQCRHDGHRQGARVGARQHREFRRDLHAAGWPIPKPVIGANDD
jgi:carboxylesterase type B